MANMRPESNIIDFPLLLIIQFSKRDKEAAFGTHDPIPMIYLGCVRQCYWDLLVEVWDFNFRVHVLYRWILILRRRRTFSFAIEEPGLLIWSH